jgi:acetyltransferase-like isoleucine patch superfamily enzyme
MEKYMKSKRAILLLLAEVIFLVLISNALLRNIVVITTETKAYAKIISIEENIGKNPYKIRLNYYNKYLEQNLEVIELCSQSVVNNLSVGSDVKIVYGKWFAKNVYIENYDNPNIGKTLILILSETILLSVIFFSIKSLKKDNNIS